MQKIKVAANTPFNGSLLTYLCDQDVRPGQALEVPLGKRRVLAWVVQTNSTEDIDEKQLKPIHDKADELLNLTAHELTLFGWMAEYYHYPMGQLIADILPKVMKRPRANTLLNEGEVKPLPPLTQLQAQIYNKLKDKLEKGFSRHLLHGVTGSGKTHIYLQLMDDMVAKGKSILFLLPEINLTPQFLEKFSHYFSCPVHVYSSEASASERHLLRQTLLSSNEPRVILGVRSAVFLPLSNLGLIIVDEEHDPSFKQDDRCTYNARDIAIKRASMAAIPVVLGSATPSLESYCASVGGEHYYPLRERAQGSILPQVELIDQRDSFSGYSDSDYWPLTTKAIEALYQAKQKNEQALVFINRLGFSSYVQCAGCGHQFHCPNCSTNLRFFKQRMELACQTCGIKTPMPKVCPECACLTLTHKGYGTEKIEEVLSRAISGLRIARFDRDEIRTMDQLRARLDSFHAHEFDVMVGTQMLSKGHNFKRVNTVIVLGIDQQLNFPDFRAMERAWQTLVQVSGRSGRFGANSKVLIQTHTPEHPLFNNVVNHHFDEFYRDEVELRKRAECPPLTKLAAIYLTHKDKSLLIREATDLSNWLSGLQQHHFSEVTVLGPRPALMEKRVNKFTWCLLLRSEQLNPMHTMINTIVAQLGRVPSLHVKVDVDPQVIF